MADSGNPYDQSRDGTSQRQRPFTALDPEYVSIDERSRRELLEFTRAFARQLKYYGPSNQHQAGDDWSQFLPADNDSQGDTNNPNLDDLLAWWENPALFAGDEVFQDRFARPHLVLFLTFLELLEHSRTQLNQFTRRHLEYYYRDILQLTARPAEPDQVHVLIDLARGQDALLVPAGTALLAGKDAAGRDLWYQTDQDQIATRAQVAELKSLRAAKRRIGLSDIRKNPGLLIDLTGVEERSWHGSGFDKSTPETKPLNRVFLALTEFTLGDPANNYLCDPGLTAEQCDAWDADINQVRQSLKMSLTVFRELMQLAQALDPSKLPAKDQWGRVNLILFASPETTSGAETDSFEQRLKTALHKTDEEYRKLFQGIAEASDIYELQRRYESLRAQTQPSEDDKAQLDQIETLITDANGLGMSVDEFREMMGIVDSFYQKWQRVFEILRTAAQRNGRNVVDQPKLREATYPAKIQELLAGTVETTLGDLQHRDTSLRNLEQAFYMSADNWAAIRSVLKKPELDVQPWEWARVYDLFDQAHRNWLMETEVEALNGMPVATDREFEAMIKAAVGHSGSDPNAGQPAQKPFLELDSDQEEDRQYILGRLRLDPVTCENIQRFYRQASDQTPEAWLGVYRQLIQAKWRQLEKPQPRPEIELWDNLFAAPDATLVLPENQSTQTQSRWQTFGGGSTDQGTQPATIGMAIASPLLSLAEGQRTITLTFNFAAPSVDQDGIAEVFRDASPLRFLLSTAKGLLEVDETAVNKVEWKDSKLTLAISLPPEHPPITPLPTGRDVAIGSPVCQVLLRDLDNPDRGVSKEYTALAQLQLEQASLVVSVTGLSHLVLQNDDGPLKSQKPFEPFGATPAAGSRLLIGHPELVTKPIDELAFEVEWMGVPNGGLTEHYKNYATPNGGDGSADVPVGTFTAAVSCVDRGVEFSLAVAAKLFKNKTQTGDLNMIPILSNSKPVQGDQDNPLRTWPAGKPVPSTDGELLDWNRFLQWRLNDPDFQHGRYPAVAAAKATELAIAIAGEGKPTAADAAKYQVNPPYTPKIKTLLVNYTASADIVVGAKDPAPGALYHLEPFGYRPMRPVDEPTTSPSSNNGSPAPRAFLLPQFPYDGELLIGLSDVTSPQNLSLLFQVADGSADPDAESAAVEWSYLDGDCWQSLAERRLLEDTTEGLIQTGIITFDLPTVAPSTLLPAGRYWIRAAVAGNPRAVSDMVAIQGQAVPATRLLDDQSPEDLGPPLSPGTISRLVVPLAGVKGVRQPHSGFGGRDAEPPERFYTRVAERLRHRSRALTCWDYERLILEAFPEIDKVKCLPVGSSDDPRDADLIQVVVIPDIRGKLPSDPFRPTAPAKTLRDIEQFLRAHAPPLARIQVNNPRFVTLKVRVWIRYQSGCNPAFYAPRLNDELVRFLTPWAFDDGAEVDLGTQRRGLYDIVNFLEERPCVDFVANLMLLYQGADGQELQGDQGNDVIYVSTREHEIAEFDEQSYEQQAFAGIGYAKVGIDFIVAAPN